MVTPAQEAALVIVMMAEIANTSQPLVIAEAKFVIPNLETNQGPILSAYKTLTTIMTVAFKMATNEIGYKTPICPTILAQTRINQCPPLIEPTLFWSKCLPHLLHQSWLQIQWITMMPLSLRLLPSKTLEGTVCNPSISPPSFYRFFAGECSDKDFNNNDVDSYDKQLENTPGWQSDNASYSSHCPREEKFTCKRPPTIAKEETFLYNFRNNWKRLTYWVMLEIKVDLDTNILFLLNQTFLMLVAGKSRTKDVYQVYQQIGVYPLPIAHHCSRWEGEEFSSSQTNKLSPRTTRVLCYLEKTLSSSCQWMVWSPTWLLFNNDSVYHYDNPWKVDILNPLNCPWDGPQWVLDWVLTPWQYFWEHTCPGFIRIILASSQWSA